MEFPLVSHKKGLKAESIGPDAHGMLLVPGLLSLEESQAAIDFAESIGFTMQGSRGPAYGEAFREHGRVNVTDEGAAQELWHSTGLAGAVRHLHIDGMRPTGLNPNLRFYRYEKGQRFGKHVDESTDLGDGRHTRFTLLIYLSGQLHQGIRQQSSAPDDGVRKGKRSNTSTPSTKQAGHLRQPPPSPPSRPSAGHASGAEPPGAQSDTCAVQPLVGRLQWHQERDIAATYAFTRIRVSLAEVGGETIFYGGPAGKQMVASVRPAPGLALLHMHGDNCLEHEAVAVHQGRKYVLRSDVVFEA
ncbi:hypothetical protein DUNSADRAFT_1788 [Dunaliella salina]|uniref:Prolyl 4-hydroxylase alpha subunit domain-containing protein n=1 Tax=Dunaliella salina TaxID=3046 RepID=A0ABQ7GWM8_DUNSA|nr:hypothetical protein DUNSADRAFT_1788 [Dunaliella salina]|eukprot:KAF5839011.1 hypothetical protein DUNSADRAFT_1788 [Dunaliella salina]